MTHAREGAYRTMHTFSDMEISMNRSKHGRWAGFAALLCAISSMTVSADRLTTAQTFVDQAAQAGMTEVALGKLAATRSNNPDVRAFAARMVEDHGRANDELAALVHGHEVDLPTSLDGEHSALVADMSARTGGDFDAAYTKQMVDDHASAVSLFRSAAASNDLTPALANSASRILPTLEEHKKMADELATKVQHGY
jgi:putative membrane protein